MGALEGEKSCQLATEINAPPPPPLPPSLHDDLSSYVIFPTGIKLAISYSVMQANQGKFESLIIKSLQEKVKASVHQHFKQTRVNFEIDDVVNDDISKSEVKRFCKCDIKWSIQEIIVQDRNVNVTEDEVLKSTESEPVNEVNTSASSDAEFVKQSEKLQPYEKNEQPTESSGTRSSVNLPPCVDASEMRLNERRITEYSVMIRANEDAKLAVRLHHSGAHIARGAAGGGAGGAAAGAGAGAGTGAGIGALIGIIGGPIGMAIGAGLGAAIGGSVGGVAGGVGGGVGGGVVGNMVRFEEHVKAADIFKHLGLRNDYKTCNGIVETVVSVKVDELQTKTLRK